MLKLFGNGMLANVKFRIFLSPVTIQCDDLGLREAGITCNVASDSSEVKLFHHVLDVPLYEIMRRRALEKVLMHSTGLSTYALNCEIGTFLRREFEVGVSRLDWAQFSEFRLATPDLEYRWHIVRLGPEQECVGRHIPLSCPLLSGPSTMRVWIKEGTTNACEKAQAGRDHREAA